MTDNIKIETDSNDITLQTEGTYVDKNINVRFTAPLAKEEEEVVITPTTETQEILPTEGKVINKVNVNAVTSEIDSNIVPENIVYGVNILGIEGTGIAEQAKKDALGNIINEYYLPIQTANETYSTNGEAEVITGRVNDIDGRLNALDANVQDYYTPDVTYDIVYSGWKFVSLTAPEGSVQVVPDQGTTINSPLRGIVLSNTTQMYELQSFKNAAISALNSYGPEISTARYIADSALGTANGASIAASDAMNRADDAKSIATEARDTTSQISAQIRNLDQKMISMYGNKNQADIQRLYNDELPTNPVVGQIFNLNTTNENDEVTKQQYLRWNGIEWEELQDKLENKLDIVSYTSINSEAYVKNYDGTQGMVSITEESTPQTIIKRDANGSFKVPNPVLPEYPANKQYVDDSLLNIKTNSVKFIDNKDPQLPWKIYIDDYHELILESNDGIKVLDLYPNGIIVRGETLRSGNDDQTDLGSSLFKYKDLYLNGNISNGTASAAITKVIDSANSKHIMSMIENADGTIDLTIE